MRNATGTTRIEHVMSMPVVVLAPGQIDARLLDRLFAWLRHVEATFSTFRPDSEIARIGRAELALRDADPDVREVLARCEEVHAATDGYFDVRAGRPGMLDPAGLVKGWAVDRAAELLDAEGVEDYAISAGGDVRLRGGPRPGGRWRVGIQHPVERDRVAAVVESECLAVATSGAYERGGHVVDPHSGRASTGALSVTVTGPDLATADAYATAAFAMGARGPHWTARLRGYEALTILADGRVLSTPSFPFAVDEPVAV